MFYPFFVFYPGRRQDVGLDGKSYGEDGKVFQGQNDWIAINSRLQSHQGYGQKFGGD